MAEVGKRKRILFIMNLPPPVHGVSVMNELIYKSARIRSEFRCDFVNSATSRSVEELQKRRFIKYFRLAVLFLKSFVKLITRRYNYVYMTPFPYGPAFIKDLWTARLVRFFRRPLVLHMHTFGYAVSAAQSPEHKRAIEQLFDSHAIIALSQHTIDDVLPFAQGPFYLLPNGIPKAHASNPHRVRTGKLNLLYFSNLMQSKGLLDFVEAAGLLAKRGFPFQLTIAGAEFDITYAELEQKLRELNISDRCVLFGKVEPSQKQKLFTEADVFVLPSRSDTFGLVLLEAMHYGVPCISTRQGAIQELLADGRGVLLEEVNSLRLAEEIEKLCLDSEARQKMSEKAFEYFSTHYTIDIFEQRLCEILNDTAKPVAIEKDNTKV